MKGLYLPLIALLSLTILVGCATAPHQNLEKVVTSVAFSPDDSLLAFATDQEITVLDVISRAQVSILRELPQDIKDADSGAYRSGVVDTMIFIDNARIVSTGMGGLVTVWDVRSGTRLARVESLPDGAFASTIDYSDSANRLVIGTSDGRILLTRLNGNDPEPLVSVAYLDGYVQDLQFGPDGRYFASALMVPAENSVEESGKDTASDSTADPATGDTHPATDGGLTKPAGRAEVSVWDAEQLEKVGNLEGADGVSKLALVPGERALLTVGEDVQVWEFLTLEQASLVRNPSMAMQYVGVGSLVTVTALAIVTSAVLGAPGLLPEVLLAPFAPLIPAVACIRTAAISPDGQYIVTTTKGPVHNVMSVIERTSNKVIEKWTAEYSVCDMQFSRDGKYLLTATSSGVWIYETTSWKKARLVEGN